MKAVHEQPPTGPHLSLCKKHRSMTHKLLMEKKHGSDEGIMSFFVICHFHGILYTLIGLRLNRAKMKLLHQIPALRPPWMRDLSAALQVAASGSYGIFKS